MVGFRDGGLRSIGVSILTTLGLAALLVMLPLGSVTPARAQIPPPGQTQGTTAHNPTPQATVNNPIEQGSTPLNSAVYANFLNGGYAAAGTAMRNLGYGTISLAAIPAGATVQDAFLLWDVLDNSQSFADGEGTFDGTNIQGRLVGTGASPCWPANGNYAYAANVTDLVSGNGTYNLSGFSSGSTAGEDPWNTDSPTPELEGASLVVVYSDPADPMTYVDLSAGSDMTEGALLQQTLSGFTVSDSPSASTTFIVADGQGAGSTGSFDGTTLVDPFAGSDPQAVPNYSLGNLWDTATYDASSLVSAGDTSESASVQGDGDCLVWVGQALSVTATPTSATTYTTPGPTKNRTIVPTSTALSPVSDGSNTITLLPQSVQQNLVGFGATLTNSSAAVLDALPSATLSKILNDLFNTQSGAGISLLRLSIGANDFSAYGCSAWVAKCSGNYTYEASRTSNFNILPFDKKIVKILQAIRAINPNITIIASPWTAPPWMKQVDSVTAEGGTNSLRSKYYSAYAQYLVDYVEAYASQGITINYLTPQNEPGAQATNYPGMAFTPSQEANFVDNYLSPNLSSASLNTQILDYDWNWNNTACTSNSCWSQSDLESLLTGAPANVVGLAWHCYTWPQGTPASESSFSGYVNVATECTGQTTGTFAGDLSWESQNLIVGGLQNGGSGAQFYNLALNASNGPQNGGGCKNQCRAVITVQQDGEFTTNPEYWTLTHATKSFEPGAAVIANSSSASACAAGTGLCAVAAVNPDGTTGLYVSNPTSSTQSFSVDDQGFGFSTSLPAGAVVNYSW